MLPATLAHLALFDLSTVLWAILLQKSEMKTLVMEKKERRYKSKQILPYQANMVGD